MTVLLNVVNVRFFLHFASDGITYSEGHSKSEGSKTIFIHRKEFFFWKLS